MKNRTWRAKTLHQPQRRPEMEKHPVEAGALCMKATIDFYDSRKSRINKRAIVMDQAALL